VSRRRAPRDLRPRGLPLFNQDEEKNPTPKVTDFKQKIRAAGGDPDLHPEYNYGMPGVLKNAIDVASRPYGDNAWNGKPVAIMSAAMGTAGGLRAQYQLRQCFISSTWMRGAAGSRHRRRASALRRQGQPDDETSKKMIAQLLQNLSSRRACCTSRRRRWLRRRSSAPEQRRDGLRVGDTAVAHHRDGLVEGHDQRLDELAGVELRRALRRSLRAMKISIASLV